ncbi:uncharacterized protein LOC126668338 [Mercurialis annua]|uniref:uncharacterized protein LOC126668338 n=1 Tax=Mercurialis annua TaxID=3986 RepID=UPI00215EAFA5|nr:uncharacterized protein LOC126668338 [Mercurialis annua]
MMEWASQMKIKILHSTPYYAQANRQAEATTKAIKLIVQKMIEDNPRQWHVFLSDAVWANRTRQKSATWTSPFRMYHSKLSKDDYFEKMVIESLDLDEERLTALDHLEAQKRRVERAYNNRVKSKSFVVGDLVWKEILPIGHKDRRSGKWSPNWEGPFIVTTKLANGAYVLQILMGKNMKGRLTVSSYRNICNSIDTCCVFGHILLQLSFFNGSSVFLNLLM